MKTWTDLTIEGRHMGVLIEDKEFDGTQCGEYDPDTRTAYIDPTMSMEQRYARCSMSLSTQNTSMTGSDY